MDDAPEQPPKTFSADEAQALLSQVAPLIQQLQGLQRSIIETNKQLDETVAKVAGGNGYPIQSLKERIQHLTTHQLQLIEAFQSALNELEELGCVVKDPSAGLADFYSLRGSELVFLCWKLGETRIEFWHTLEGGYAGRQPLDAPQTR